MPRGHAGYGHTTPQSGVSGCTCLAGTQPAGAVGTQAAGREAVRPPNQLVLTDKELEEEILRTLTSANPAAPHNVVRYNYRERLYKPEPIVEHVTLHYAAESSLQYVGSGADAKPLERSVTESAGRPPIEAGPFSPVCASPTSFPHPFPPILLRMLGPDPLPTPAPFYISELHFSILLRLCPLPPSASLLSPPPPSAPNSSRSLPAVQ